MNTITGTGHQVSAEVKRLESVKTTLEEAALILGYPSEHVELQRLINAAIEEANAIACAADEYLSNRY